MLLFYATDQVFFVGIVAAVVAGVILLCKAKPVVACSDGPVGRLLSLIAKGVGVGQYGKSDRVDPVKTRTFEKASCMDPNVVVAFVAFFVVVAPVAAFVSRSDVFEKFFPIIDVCDVPS